METRDYIVLVFVFAVLGLVALNLYCSTFPDRCPLPPITPTPTPPPSTPTPTPPPSGSINYITSEFSAVEGYEL